MHPFLTQLISAPFAGRLPSQVGQEPDRKTVSVAGVSSQERRTVANSFNDIFLEVGERGKILLHPPEDANGSLDLREKQSNPVETKDARARSHEGSSDQPIDSGHPVETAELNGPKPDHRRAQAAGLLQRPTRPSGVMNTPQTRPEGGSEHLLQLEASPNPTDLAIPIAPTSDMIHSDPEFRDTLGAAPDRLSDRISRFPHVDEVHVKGARHVPFAGAVPETPKPALIPPSRPIRPGPYALQFAAQTAEYSGGNAHANRPVSLHAAAEMAVFRPDTTPSVRHSQAATPQAIGTEGHRAIAAVQHPAAPSRSRAEVDLQQSSGMPGMDSDLPASQLKGAVSQYGIMRTPREAAAIPSFPKPSITVQSEAFLTGNPVEPALPAPETLILRPAAAATPPHQNGELQEISARQNSRPARSVVSQHNSQSDTATQPATLLSAPPTRQERRQAVPDTPLTVPADGATQPMHSAAAEATAPRTRNNAWAAGTPRFYSQQHRAEPQPTAMLQPQEQSRSLAQPQITTTTERLNLPSGIHALSPTSQVEIKTPEIRGTWREPGIPITTTPPAPVRTISTPRVNSGVSNAVRPSEPVPLAMLNRAKSKAAGQAVPALPAVRSTGEKRLMLQEGPAPIKSEPASSRVPTALTFRDEPHRQAVVLAQAVQSTHSSKPAHPELTISRPTRHFPISEPADKVSPLARPLLPLSPRNGHNDLGPAQAPFQGLQPRASSEPADPELANSRPTHRFAVSEPADKANVSIPVEPSQPMPLSKVAATGRNGLAPAPAPAQAVQLSVSSEFAISRPKHRFALTEPVGRARVSNPAEPSQPVLSAKVPAPERNDFDPAQTSISAYRDKPEGLYDRRSDRRPANHSPIAPTAPFVPTSMAPTAAVQARLDPKLSQDAGKGPMILSDAAETEETQVAAPPLSPMRIAQAQPHRVDLPMHLARQIADAMQSGGSRSVDITLNPEELGRVRLSLTSADGGITVNVVTERPETQDLLRRHIDQLGQEFQNLGYRNISFAFSSQDQGPDHREPGNHGGAARDPVEPIGIKEIAVAHESPANLRLPGLDLRL